MSILNMISTQHGRAQYFFRASLDYFNARYISDENNFTRGIWINADQMGMAL